MRKIGSRNIVGVYDWAYRGSTGLCSNGNNNNNRSNNGGETINNGESPENGSVKYNRSNIKNRQQWAQSIKNYENTNNNKSNLAHIG